MQAMQGRIDSLGQRLVHALDLGDFLDPRRLQARQAAEMSQQVGAPARADPGDVLEPAAGARFLPPAAVAGDGEAMRFVADLLDQLQALGGGAGAQLAAVGQQQALVARTAFLALGHAHHQHPRLARGGGGGKLSY